MKNYQNVNTTEGNTSFSEWNDDEKKKLKLIPLHVQFYEVGFNLLCTTTA